MRKLIVVAASAALASAMAIAANPASAMSAGSSGVRGAANGFGMVEPVARVCREVCKGDVCRKRCFYRNDDDDVVIRRGHWRHRHPEPGVGLEFRIR